MLEAHDTPGGYAQTFTMGSYRFCAQVHYIFGCGEGEPIHQFLDSIGLADSVTFRRLDPEGFDHVVVAGDRFRIPNGFRKFRDRLIYRFPDAARPIRRYFDLVMAMWDEIQALPDEIGARDLATAPFRFRRVLRYLGWTLQRYFDHIAMPPPVQAVLAGQAGDYLLPPEQVSLLLHVALIAGYDRGAYYPEKHFSHLIDSVVDTIRDAPGCDVLLEHEVVRFHGDGKRISSVETTDGRIFRARRFISNVDPQVTMKLIGQPARRRRFQRRLSYEYSSSNFTMYLGVKDLDLRDYGFGSYNVWHYPHRDINQIYRRQVVDRDLSDPWLFLSTPTLHSDAPGLAPPGHQVLEVATSCDYAHFEALRAAGGRAYTKEKVKIRDGILDVIETNYIPGLRKHLAMRVAGTPLTNERFCRAPRGNAYGSVLTPSNVFPRVDFETPLDNLYLVNATAGFPSIGGTVAAGMKLYRRLTA